MFQVGTRYSLWVLGTTFAIIIAFQYFELPYGNVVSLFSSGKDHGALKSRFGSEDTFKFEGTGEVVVQGSNSTSTHADHEISTTRDILDDAFAPQEAQEPEPSFVQQKNITDNTSTYDDYDIPVRDTLDDAFAPEEAREPEPSFVQKSNISVFASKASEANSTMVTESIGRLETPFGSPSPSLPPMNLYPIVNSEGDEDTSSGHLLSAASNTSSGKKDIADNSPNAGQLQIDLISLENDSSMTSAREVKKELDKPLPAVIPISEMNNLLLESQASYHPTKPLWSSTVDQQLIHAKYKIYNAAIIQNDSLLYAPLYRNISTFKRSYELMEEMLKIYIYKEGKRPIFHQAVLKGIYASEGWFLKLLEANKKFVTRDPRKAHLFYLPFSSRMLEEVLYVPDSHNHKNLIRYLKNYLDTITSLHPFWNRTGGADHFLVACHDWAPSETKEYMANCIRALCNADVKEGFVFGKDVSLPETYVRSAQNLLRDLGGQPPSRRSILAFFAGSMHGYLRPILLQHWGNNKDPDMKIFGRMPKAKKGKMNNYVRLMQSSKYCICAKGYEVNSPRVVEAIFYECVPVIISDNFVPPFFEVLDWESFAVFVLEKDIPNLKSILLAIPEKRFRQMQLRVKKVQQHFLWHAKPVKYDIFHMILHSVWYNRLIQITPI